MKEQNWIIRSTGVQYLADISEVDESSSSPHVEDNDEKVDDQLGARKQIDEENIDDHLRNEIGEEDYNELYNQLYNDDAEEEADEELVDAYGRKSLDAPSAREEEALLVNDGEGERMLPAEAEPRPQQNLYHLRWLVVMLICLVMACIHFSYDIPAVLHQQIIDHFRERNADGHSTKQHDGHLETYFNLLYTLYSVPNVVLPFFGSFLVDKLGPSLSLVGFLACCFVGQLTTAVGVAKADWTIALLGRFLFGLGGETAVVAYSSLLPNFFDETNYHPSRRNDRQEAAGQSSMAGRGLAFSLMAAVMVSRFGGIANNFISVGVANAKSPTTSMFLGTWLLLSAFVATCVVYLMEKSVLYLPVDRLRDNNSDLAAPLLQADIPCDPLLVERPRQSSFSGLGKGFWLLCISSTLSCSCVLVWNNVASGILLERDFFKAAPPSCQLPHPDQCTWGRLQPSPTFNKPFDAASTNQSCGVVLPTSLNVTRVDRHGNHQPFTIANLSKDDVDCSDPFWADDCTKDYCSALKESTKIAGGVMSIPFFLLAVLPPLLEKIIRPLGKRVTLSFVCSGVLFLVHMCFALTSLSAIVLVVFQGLAIATYITLIGPVTALVIPKDGDGAARAFGVMMSFQNLAYAVFPIAVGVIHDLSKDSFLPNVELFFCLCGFLGTLTGITLFCEDYLNGGKLNGSIA